MIRTIRLFLVLEAALFLAAALVHSGYLVPGYLVLAWGLAVAAGARPDRGGW